MLARLDTLARAARIAIARKLRRPGEEPAPRAEDMFERVLKARRALAVVAIFGPAAWVLVKHPPPTLRQSADPSASGLFQRWRDPAWKKGTVSVRD